MTLSKLSSKLFELPLPLTGIETPFAEDTRSNPTLSYRFPSRGLKLMCKMQFCQQYDRPSVKYIIDERKERSPMTQTRLKPKDQRLVYAGISWEEFKSIETGFANKR